MRDFSKQLLVFMFSATLLFSLPRFSFAVAEPASVSLAVPPASSSHEASSIVTDDSSLAQAPADSQSASSPPQSVPPEEAPAQGGISAEEENSSAEEPLSPQAAPGESESLPAEQPPSAESDSMILPEPPGAEVMALGAPSVIGNTIYGNGTSLLIRKMGVAGITILTTVFRDNGVVGVYDPGVDVPITALAGLDLSSYTVFGGGTSDVTGDTRVTMLSGTVSRIFGGGDSGKVTGNSRVSVLGGTITDSVYGAGNQATAQVGGYTEVFIDSTSDNTLVSGSVVSGGLNGAVGGQGAATAGNRACNVLVSQSASYTTYIQQAVMGGGYSGSVTSGGTMVRITGGVIGWNTTAGTVYGAGYGTAGSTVSGKVDVTISGGQMHFLYGGAYAASVSGSVTVVLTGGTVLKDLSGGGTLASATISGTVSVSVANSTIVGYAGAGAAETVVGSRSFAVSGNTKIGKAGTNSGLLLKDVTENLVSISGPLTCQAGEIYLRRAANPVSGAAVARAVSAANADATKFSVEPGCALRVQGTDIVWSIANLYLDGTAGNDALDGLTPATAVRTVARAKAAVNVNGSISVTGNITIAANTAVTWDFSGTTILVVRYFNYSGELITVQQNASLTLKGMLLNGGITVSIAASAPMVSVAAGGTLNLVGARLGSNMNTSGVGGIYAAEGAQITMAGEVYVTGSTGVSGQPSNLYLAGAGSTGTSQTVSVTAPFSGTVGISVPKAPTPFSGAVSVVKTSGADTFVPFFVSDAGYRCTPDASNTALLLKTAVTPPSMADTLLPAGAESTLRFTVPGIDMTAFATPQYVRLFRDGMEVTSSVSLRGGADGSVTLTVPSGFPVGRYQILLDGTLSNTFVVSTWAVTGALAAISDSGAQGSRVTLRLTSGYTGEVAQASVGAGSLSLNGTPVTLVSTSEISTNRTLWGSTNAMRRFAVQVNGVDLSTSAALATGDNEIALLNANALNASLSGSLTLPVSISAGASQPARASIVIPFATQQAQMSATVPLTMTVAVKNDGTIVAPDSTRYAIANESPFPISVTNIAWTVTNTSLFRQPDRLALTLNGESLTNGLNHSPQVPANWTVRAGSALSPERLPLSAGFGLGTGNALLGTVETPVPFCTIRYTIAVTA